MNRFAKGVLRLRILILIVTLACTLFFLSGITRLSINSDITTYLKPEDPAMKLFNRIGEEYGGNHMVMVAVTGAKIVSERGLLYLKRLTDTYRQIEGVASVTSLINIIDMKDTEYGIEIGKLINEYDIPRDEHRLEALESYILSKEIYRGKVISEDGSATILVCRLNPEYNKFDLAKAIKTVTESQKEGFRVYYSGYPIQMLEMSFLLLNDLKRLVPIVISIIVLVLYFSFRTIRGIVFPLLIVVISVIWTLGLMGYTNTPLSLISNVIPIILLAIGTAYGIHLLAKYYEELSLEKDSTSGIIETVAGVGIPIVLAGITTVIGFLSFTGAYITAITEFGIFTAFGVLCAMLLSVSFLPAALSFMKPRKMKMRNGRDHPFTKLMRVLAETVPKNRRLVIMTGTIIGGLSLVIIPRIKVETSLINFFPRGSAIREADEVIKEKFGGSIPVQIVIQGDLKDPQVLKKMVMLEKYLAQIPFMSNTQSIADLVARMNEIINHHETIPERKDEVANLLFLLEGEDILEQLVNDDYTEGVIQATFGIEASRLISHAVAELDIFLEKELNQPFVMLRREKTMMHSENLFMEQSLQQIARLIYYDYKRFFPEGGLQKEQFLEQLHSTGTKTPALLVPEIKEHLFQELVTFFEEESAVIIDDGEVRNEALAAVMEFAENEGIEQNTLLKTLERIIPLRYWDGDPELLPLTVQFLLPKIVSAQKESATTQHLEEMLNTLLRDCSGEKEFVKKLRDDLWLLTESSVIIPASLRNPSHAPFSPPIFSLHGELSGMIRILDRLNVSLRRSQVQSIIIALIAVFSLLILQFRSFRMGLVTLSPIVFVILLNFAVMGYAKVPLDYATMLAGSILIGVGIDYSIHFASRFRLELGSSQDMLSSLHTTYRTTGVAILINAIMVALGFFVLIAGNFVPVKREGWMIGVLMLVSATAALVFLPSLMLSLKGILHPRTQSTHRR